jgi:hypothetical protein
MRRFFSIALAGLVLGACADANASSDAAASAEATASPDAAMAVALDQSLPTILVYKTATCGCCKGWVEHLEASGFTVDARDINATELMMTKRDSGVPTQMSSCHTAIIDGYVVEGHVPAEQIRRLLAERPDIAGIAAPGMPIGSPGMEGRNAQPYEIFSFTHDGEATVYAEIDPR